MARLALISAARLGRVLDDMSYLALAAELVITLVLALLAYAYLLAAERRILAPDSFRGAQRRGSLAPLRDALHALAKRDLRTAGAGGRRMAVSAVLSLGTSLALLSLVPWGRMRIAGWTWTPLALAPKSLLPGLVLEGLGLVAVALYGSALPTAEARGASERVATQAMAYGLALALALAGPLMLSRSLDLERMVQAQAINLPFIVYQPLGGLLCLLAMTLGYRRLPLSLPGTADPLLLDHQLQHAGVTLALWHGSEYLHLIAWSALWVTIYLGGAEGGTLGGVPGTVVASLVVLLIILWLRRRPRSALRGRWGRRLFPMVLGLGLLNMALTALMLYWGRA